MYKPWEPIESYHFLISRIPHIEIKALDLYALKFRSTKRLQITCSTCVIITCSKNQLGLPEQIWTEVM